MNTHHVRCMSAAGACQLGSWRTMNYGAHVHTHIDSRATNGGSHGTHWDYISGKWQSNWQHFFSDSVLHPQIQLRSGRKSGLTEVKRKHSSLLTAHIGSESGITMPILPIVLFSWTPGATWRAWFFFFSNYICRKILAVRTRTNSSTCATMCVQLGQARCALKTKTGCVWSLRK